MKKVLLASAAAVALAVGTGAAHADDPVKLTLSGNLVQWIGFGSSDSSFLRDEGISSHNTFMQYQDSGITFAGTTKLDNGLTVGATIGLETGSSTQEQQSIEGKTTNQFNPINGVTYATVSGSFGSINLGRMYDVVHDNAIDAPDEGYMFVSDGYWGDPWANGGFLTGAGANTTGRTVMYDDNTTQQVRYTTPSFSGFQAGIDFGEASSQVAGGLVALTNSSGTKLKNVLAYKDAFHAVVTYGGDMGEAKVKAFVGYAEEAGRPSGTTAPITYYDNTAINGGVSVTVKGFTVAGSIIQRSAPSAYKVQGQDGLTWDLGVAYESGPWGVSFAYLNSQAPDSGSNALDPSLTDQFQLFDFGAHYTLGPGITLNLNIYHTETAADFSTANANMVTSLNTAGTLGHISASSALLSTNIAF